MIERPWRRYGVQARSKRPILSFVAEALERSGVVILSRPSPDEAPFLFRVRLPTGEELWLLCYAFLANKYLQKGRPADEHRFQIKYGGQLGGYHDVFIDRTRAIVTLFFGAHLEEGVFIAVDPAMHNPTRFSSSVEIKTRELEEARRRGWFGYERERSDARRQQPAPMASNATETVVAFTAEHFLRYVQLECLATGLDSAGRWLLVERLAPRSTSAVHPLENQFELSATQILDVISKASRLHTAVRGGVAELHLKRHLETVSELTKVVSLDEDGRPDFVVGYSGRDFTVECKNLLRSATATKPRIDFQKTRASKSDPCSRYYRSDAFDVLAACLHPLTQRWEFRFCRISTLARHSKCQDHCSPRVVAAGDNWFEDIREVLLR